MMVTVTVVEPNTLLRLGILKLLQSLDCTFSCTGINYAQLFRGDPRQAGSDLMLLSVPDVYERMIELVTAAQQGYAPKRTLLLSDTQTLPYSLLNLPSALAGYISKHSSQEVLKSSIMLVLAGGKCFPHPEMIRRDDAERDPQAGDCSQPKRRWYDKHQVPPATDYDEPQADNLLLAPEIRRTRLAPANGTPPGAPAFTQEKAQILTSELIGREADMLGLTPRQYEVLALLAKGYPLKKISRDLNISVATAKTHAEALYQRLAVNNRNAAVYAAVSRGATLGWQPPYAAAPAGVI
jgi:DNA-binding NarL/FixJ family response regulator